MNGTTKGTSQDSPRWESELAQLLEELASVQEELLDVLDTKRDLMMAADLEGMATVQHRETELCQRLEACQDRRQMLLKRAGEQGLPDDSIATLAGHIPQSPSTTLHQQIAHSTRQSRLLQHQSLTNWVVAQRTLIHLSQMIEIIATGGRLKPTYEKGKSTSFRGALVDQEA